MTKGRREGGREGTKDGVRMREGQVSGLEFLALQLTILCQGCIEQWEAVVGRRRAFDPRVAQLASAWKLTDNDL